MLFGRMYVAPGIVDYLQRHPGMEVNALFVDRVVNLVEEGLDVGVRIGELPDSTIKAIRVGSVRRIVCASPAYLESHGVPASPAELSRHVVVLSSSVTPIPEWKFATQGATVAVRVKPRLTVSTNEAAIDAALGGFGITRLLSYQVAPYVRTGQLQIVLPDHEPQRLPIHIVHREGRQSSAKVRTFVDLMVARLRSDSALN